MNTIEIPCTISHIGIRLSDKYTVSALLILNDAPYIRYNEPNFKPVVTIIAFFANVDLEHQGVKYIFNLRLTPKENYFKIIPNKEFEQMKTVLSQINLNSKILPNNKKIKTSKI